MVRSSTTKNRRSRKEKGIFFPKDRFSVKYRIEIDWNGGSTEDITNYASSVTVPLKATEATSSFNASIDDPNNHFRNKFEGGETVRVWIGYNTASKLMITARLEKWSYSYQSTDGIKISEIRGRAWPEFIDKKVSIQFSKRPIENAISDVIEFYDDLTFTIPGLKSDTISANYQRMSGLAIVRDICERFNLEFYITSLGVVTLIDSTTESSKITTDAITIQQNLMGIEKWENDTTPIKNRVIVSGKQDEFVNYLRTDNDESSQGSLWVKSKEVFDSSISDRDELSERSSQELSRDLSVQVVGRMKCVGMSDAQPGKRVFVSAPPLVEGWFVVRSATHVVSEDGWVTNFTINDFSKYDLVKILVEQKKVNRELRPASLDKVYDDCIVFDWKEMDDYTFNDSHIVSEQLELESGQTSGTARINNDMKGLITDVNTSHCYVKMNGTNLENCSVKVSNDDGLNSITFAGSEINSSEKGFSTLDDTHRITLSIVEGVNGSLSPPVIKNMGVYLLHDS